MKVFLKYWFCFKTAQEGEMNTEQKMLGYVAGSTVIFEGYPFFPPPSLVSQVCE